MPEFTFTERGPLEQGFAEVFQREIVPLLERHEKRRRDMRSKALTGIGASGVAGAGGEHLAALHCLGVDRGRREVEPDLRPVLTLFGLDQDAVADDDETLLRFRHCTTPPLDRRTKSALGAVSPRVR